MSAWKVSLGGNDSVDVATPADAVKLGQYIGKLIIELNRHREINAIVYEECSRHMFLGGSKGRFEITEQTMQMLGEAYSSIPHNLRGRGL